MSETINWSPVRQIDLSIRHIVFFGSVQSNCAF